MAERVAEADCKNKSPTLPRIGRVGHPKFNVQVRATRPIGAARSGDVADAQADARKLSEAVEARTANQKKPPAAFGGNLLVLNFWETSCIPCVKELPSLSDFARAFRARGVVVVAVGADQDVQKYSRFLTDHHVALETYRDPSRQISKSFGTYEFPETYIIQHGRIVRKVVGGIEWMNDDTASFIRKRLGSK